MSLNVSKISTTLLHNIDIVSFLNSKDNILIAINHQQSCIQIPVNSINRLFNCISSESEEEDLNFQLIKYISFIVLPKCLTQTQYSIRSTEYESILLYINILHIHFGIHKSALMSASSLKKITQMIQLTYKAISPYIIVSIVPYHNQLMKGSGAELIKRNENNNNKLTGSVYSTIKSQTNLNYSFMSQNSSFADYSDKRPNTLRINTSPNLDTKRRNTEKDIPALTKYYSIADVKGINHLVQFDYYNEYINMTNTKTNKSSKDIQYILVDLNKKMFRTDKNNLRPTSTFSNQDIWIPVRTSSDDNSMINLEEYELVASKLSSSKNNEEEIDMLDFYGNSVVIKPNQYFKISSFSNQIPKRQKMYVISFARVYLRDKETK